MTGASASASARIQRRCLRASCFPTPALAQQRAAIPIVRIDEEAISPELRRRMGIVFAAGIPHRGVERGDRTHVGEDVAVLELLGGEGGGGGGDESGAHYRDAEAERFGVGGLQERGGAELHYVVGGDDVCFAGSTPAAV